MNNFYFDPTKLCHKCHMILDDYLGEDRYDFPSDIYHRSCWRKLPSSNRQIITVKRWQNCQYKRKEEAFQRTIEESKYLKIKLGRFDKKLLESTPEEQIELIHNRVLLKRQQKKDREDEAYKQDFHKDIHDDFDVLHLILSILI